ncbi:MAG TPA: GNAT family N-acetyltransferase [Exilispira sp.]|nr:GNAT family N-acetyltransferase [Exilispira sp.]
MISIRVATRKDSYFIARLHQKYINKGFLSILGISFLNALYKYIATSKESFCIVAEESDKILGFVSMTENVSKLYKSFIKKNFAKIIIMLFPKILNVKILKKIYETLKYPSEKLPDLPDAELLSIVVDSNYQGKNISRLLFEALLYECDKRNIKSFKVVVGDNLARAKRFYEKMGGKKVNHIEVHKGEKSLIYVCENI